MHRARERSGCAGQNSAKRTLAPGQRAALRGIDVASLPSGWVNGTGSYLRLLSRRPGDIVPGRSAASKRWATNSGCPRRRGLRGVRGSRNRTKQYGI